mmetsp:Transcript_39601/g.60588  ORF Transcript_39601/g.60588 Transcript_39601/m.60588 type:complete len:95 (+) Transcript_39601:32-316(+)
MEHPASFSLPSEGDISSPLSSSLEEHCVLNKRMSSNTFDSDIDSDHQEPNQIDIEYAEVLQQVFKNQPFKSQATKDKARLRNPKATYFVDGKRL